MMINDHHPSIKILKITRSLEADGKLQWLLYEEGNKPGNSKGCDLSEGSYIGQDEMSFLLCLLNHF